MSNEVKTAEKANKVETVVENATVVEETKPVVEETKPVVEQVQYPEGKHGEFIGIISTSRVLSEASMNGSVQVRQALLLITLRQGRDKFQASVGADIIGKIAEYAADGFIGKPAEVTYETCIKGVTGYADKDGNRIAHTFTGNRIISVEPMDDSSYMSICMMDSQERNAKLISECDKNAGALAQYLTGTI